MKVFCQCNLCVMLYCRVIKKNQFQPQKMQVIQISSKVLYLPLNLTRYLTEKMTFHLFLCRKTTEGKEATAQNANPNTPPSLEQILQRLGLENFILTFQMEQIDGESLVGIAMSFNALSKVSHLSVFIYFVVYT